MPRGDRDKRDSPLDQGFGVVVAVVLACAVVGALAFSLGRDSERDSKRASEYENYAKWRKRVYCIDLAGASLSKCEIEQEQSSREAYQAERDLEAQRDMALWALAVFVISSITVGLTLWALFYLRGTLIATREAVKDTGDATKAMISANVIARNAQRAWIKIHPALLKFSSSASGSYSLEYGCIFENIGQTIACDVVCTAQI